MGTISIQSVAKQFGSQVVLRDASVELQSGETVGLVGPNGAGKTTIFRLIIRRFPPDLGTVTCSKGMDIGYLPQEPEVDLDATLHDEVLSAFADVLAIERKMEELAHAIAERHAGPEYESLLAQYEKAEAQFVAADGYAIETQLKEIVGGLGFTPEDLKLPMRALSGGQKCRAALAKLLLQDSTYLLLDEPTNHLDIDAARWLEKFLRSHHGGAAVISHDRYLLDRIADRIIEVDGGRVNSFPGNYTNYVETRELRRLTQERQYEKDQAFIAKERDYIARNIASKRTGVARGRRTHLERRLAAGEFTLARPGARKELKLDFSGAEQKDRTIFDAEGLAKKFGDKSLFHALSLRIASGERLGITGPNGTGKSTLLKILLGLLAADTGRVRVDPKASIGYYAQESHDLDPRRTILAEIQSVRQELTEQQARTILGRFLFSGDDVFKPVARLSGGEQSRVRLTKLILANPNVLVLDEPTNHLDIPSREALEEALDEFPGTIIAVSHDRYFLDRIVERLLVIRPEGSTQFRGGYTEYIEAEDARAASERLAAEREAERQRADARRADRKAADRGGDSGRADARSKRRVGKEGLKSRFDKLALDELEAFIATCETEIAEMTERFSEPVIARDRAALAELNSKIDVLKAELAEAEAAWYRRG